MQDIIDPDERGLVLAVLTRGDLLALLYADRDRILGEAIGHVKNVFAFSREKVESPKLILKALAKI